MTGMLAADAAMYATEDQTENERTSEVIEQCDVLGDIFGNPFEAPPCIDPARLAWNDGTIVKLAEAAYQQRTLPSGELDQDRLGVLADALEEVGADPLLLEHLRSPGVHVRGCWVIDVLTGRK